MKVVKIGIDHGTKVRVSGSVHCTGPAGMKELGAMQRRCLH